MVMQTMTKLRWNWKRRTDDDSYAAREALVYGVLEKESEYLYEMTVAESVGLSK